MAIQYLSPEELPVLPPKVLVAGMTGTGKSTLAAYLALGIRDLLGWSTPIVWIDTEERAQAAVSNVFNIVAQKNQVKVSSLVQIVKTRSIFDARTVIQDCEKAQKIVLIDQASHLVDDMRAAHLKKVRRDRLYIHDYGILKPLFRKTFLDPYLYSSVPVILVARGKDDLRDEIDEDQSTPEKTVRNLVSHGTKARLDGDTGYEAYLNIMMYKELNPHFKPNARKNANKQRDVIYAVVEKDNYGPCHGQSFFNPSFKDFVGHFKAMGIEKDVELKAERKPVESQPEQMRGEFESDMTDEQRRKYAQQVELWEQIVSELTIIYSASQGNAKAMKTQALSAMAGTTSVKAWKRFDVELLKFYLTVVQEFKNEVFAGKAPKTPKELDTQIKEMVKFLRELQAAAPVPVNGNANDDELPFD